MPSVSILYFDFFYIEARSIYKTSTYRAVNSISLLATKLLILPIDDPPNQSSWYSPGTRFILPKNSNYLSKKNKLPIPYVRCRERGDRVKNQTGPAGSRVRESIVATIMNFPCCYRGNNERVNFSSLSGCPSLRAIPCTPQSVFPVPGGIFFASLLSLVIGWLLMAHDCLSTLVYDVFAILSYTSRCHFIFTDRSWDGRLFHEEISIGKTTFNRDLSIREVGF